MCGLPPLSGSIALLHVLSCWLLTVFHFHFTLNLANTSPEKFGQLKFFSISTPPSSFLVTRFLVPLQDRRFGPFVFMYEFLRSSLTRLSNLFSCGTFRMTSRSFKHRFQSNSSLVTSAFVLK